MVLPMGFWIQPSCSGHRARMFGGMDGAYDVLEGDIKAGGEGGEKVAGLDSFFIILFCWS